MKLRTVVALMFVMAGLALFGMPSWGGDKKQEKKTEGSKEVIVNSELINSDVKDKVLTESYCKTYTFKMIMGKTYQIDLMSRDFDAYLRLETSKGDQVAADDDSGGMLNARIIYKAPMTDDYQIHAMSLGGGSMGKFTLIVREQQLEVSDGKPIELKLDKGQVSYKGNLLPNDPRYKNQKLHKLFLVQLEEGKTYQIDHMSQAFDAYLYFEGADGSLIAQDDDGGEGLNSRIIHKATKTGKHRIIATSLSGSRTGQFELVVRQTDGNNPPEEKNNK